MTTPAMRRVLRAPFDDVLARIPEVSSWLDDDGLDLLLAPLAGARRAQRARRTR